MSTTTSTTAPPKVKELTEADRERMVQAALRRRESQRTAYAAHPDKKREYSRLYKQAKRDAAASAGVEA